VPQKEYLGGVSATTLSGSITDSATSFTVAAGGGTTFPDGSSYPFVIVIGRGTASEEKILCASRSGDNFTVTTRGYDGTTATSHSGGPAVEHCIDALVINEASAHIYDTSAAHAATAISNTPAGNIVATTVQAAINELDTEKLATTAGLDDLAGVDLTGIAAGSILYYNGTNIIDLGIGTAAQVLRVNSGATAPEWATIGTAVGARAYRSTSATIATSTWTSISFNAEAFDSDTFHDNATNPSRFTVPAGKAGKYLLHGVVSFAPDVTGIRHARWLLNGTTQMIVFGINSQGTAYRSRVPVTTIVDLSVGDYVELQGFQNSGSSLEVGDTTNGGEANESWGSLVYLGA
jgi:hypothetical protein